MNPKYEQIWTLAKPYYEQGRSYDIPQIEWMVEQAEEIGTTHNLNLDLLIPLIILHDTGYSVITNKNPNIKSIETKILHMKEGGKIAQTILEQIDYNTQLHTRIIHYISVHDNWALGDDTPYQGCKEMAIFNDLDFLVALRNRELFDLRAASMNISPEEMYHVLTKEEKLTRRPLCTPETQQMFTDFMAARKEELDSNQTN